MLFHFYYRNIACLLSGETQRRALCCYWNEEIEIFHSPVWESNPDAKSDADPLRHDDILHLKYI